MENTANNKSKHSVRYIIDAIVLFVVIALITRSLYQNHRYITAQDNLYESAKESAFSGDYATAMLDLNRLDDLAYPRCHAYFGVL